MAKDPAFLFYYVAFLHGTRYFNFEEKGLYITLLCEQADSPTGSIPEEDVNNICKSCDKQVIKTVMEKFDNDSNGFYNIVLRGHQMKRRDYCNSRKTNRLGKTKKNNICKTYDNHMVNKNINKDQDINESAKTNAFPFSVRFSEVWNLYPSKVGKKAAERHFKATVKNDIDFERIKKALEIYLKTERVINGYVQNGSTWFNDWETWLDYKEPDSDGILERKPIVWTEEEIKAREL